MDPLHHVLDQVLFHVDLGSLRVGVTKHMIGVVVVALLVFVVMFTIAAQAKRSIVEERAPRGRFANFFEALILYVRDEMVMPNMGQHGVKYIPVFLTFFFFILFGNLVGMIPQVGAATGNINVTGTLAMLVFLMIFVFGSIEQRGLHKFLFNLVPRGVPFWLWPLMFVIELIGPVAKCFALAMRLFANMIAGHIVIASFLALGVLMHSAAVEVVGMIFAIAMSMLEVFVCFLQAYIFTLLAIVFIGAAVHPEH